MDGSVDVEVHIPFIPGACTPQDNRVDQVQVVVVPEPPSPAAPTLVELAEDLVLPADLALEAAWVTDPAGQQWSQSNIEVLAIRLFWRSMEELALSNNEGEKWDVLKWIFEPAIRMYFVYGQPTVVVHENDEPFSFHNCCLAVGMDEDVVRTGVRKNVDPEIMKAIDRVCTY